MEEGEKLTLMGRDFYRRGAYKNESGAFCTVTLRSPCPPGGLHHEYGVVVAGKSTAKVGGMLSWGDLLRAARWAAICSPSFRADLLEIVEALPTARVSP